MPVGPANTVASPAGFEAEQFRALASVSVDPEERFGALPHATATDPDSTPTPHGTHPTRDVSPPVQLERVSSPEEALGVAIARASAAGEWSLVGQLAEALRALVSSRPALPSPVVQLETERARRGR